MSRYLLNLLVLILIFIVASPQDAQAYIDPGSTSYMVQLLIAALVGAAYSIKVYWQKIVGFFKNIFTKNKKEK